MNSQTLSAGAEHLDVGGLRKKMGKRGAVGDLEVVVSRGYEEME